MALRTQLRLRLRLRLSLRLRLRLRVLVFPLVFRRGGGMRPPAASVVTRRCARAFSTVGAGAEAEAGAVAGAEIVA